ncbi:DUF29 domain-containing protein [Nitrosococcus watsonii]|uniref:DUF29 domain-containing protein n=1 Tax=Nitrosococcus watsoni (strain C-113) TaxID=105559 RepID=D8K756_NITWC|nr:DUF29 domain-containing protein [Nitrosococcus watsonii]ADJ28733.1 protein of unknown function DUF29 [Nitrosococcus watsonii C-113]
MIDPNKDFYGWTQETAEKLRQGRFSEVNLAHLIEEIEDMGKSERRALESRLTVLLTHLLKWEHQPNYRNRSWQLTIKGQRVSIRRLIRGNLSLKAQRLAILAESYESAAIDAARETGLEENIFPATFEQTGWTWEQVLDMAFLPE